jgi:hypothetical protein
VDSDVPWWLAVIAPTQIDENQAVVRVSAPPPIPVKALESEMVPVVRPRQAEVATARLREAEMAGAKAREAEMAAIRVREAEIVAARQREAEMAAEQARAEQARVEQSRMAQIRAGQARTDEARTAQAEEDFHPGATRLSGLRNVLFSLGLNNLNKTRESEGQPEQALPPREAVAQPVEYHRTFVPYTEPGAGASSKVVTTTPEFLPPQQESKGRRSDSEGVNRRDRRDSYDDVEILPSWRGQYKRKD